MRKQYEPSFLVSIELPKELHDQIAEYARSRGVPEEEAYREAVKFFSAKCVHTQAGQRKGRRQR